MLFRSAHSLADYAEKRGINPEDIVPKMDEPDVFAFEAAEVAERAMLDGVARLSVNKDELFRRVKNEIDQSRSLIHQLMDLGFISAPPREIINRALQDTLARFPHE